ncbi:MAG: DUF1446 domain-containing protein [Desulfurococcales archaeon]|nr:DUF1446 domain-containing protein [Desulfurococcales archaeon]
METRIYSPTAILGYGFPKESLERALQEEPDIIAVDAGSTDPGPYYLGEGIPFVTDSMLYRDLTLLIEASYKHKIPLAIGTSGGSGARSHVDKTLSIIKDILKEKSYRARIAVVYSDVDKKKLMKLLTERKHRPLGKNNPLGELTEDKIRESTRIVAQLGIEPIMKALDEEPDIIVAGRVVDVAVFAALSWIRNQHKGLAVHLGKVLECGAIAAEPGSGSDGMMGILRNNEFEVYSVNPSRRATVLSVAEHALYERTDPFREYVPGGYADLSQATYEDAGYGHVVVKGTGWVDLGERYVKLEGARLAGHRYVVVAGVRDPLFISRREELVDKAIEAVKERIHGEYNIYVHFYGANAVMGDREPNPVPGHELGIIIEVVSRDQELSKTIAGSVRSTLLHLGWPGRITTAGNLALPFSPSDLYAGKTYEWSIWHLIEERDPLEFSSLRVLEV